MTYARGPIPDHVRVLMGLVARHTPLAPNNCLLNYYVDGSGTMGWHSDESAPLVTGTGVAIVSLGAARKLHFRRTSDHGVTHEITLAPGSLLYLPESLQRDWQHALPAEPGAGARVSATFRQLVDDGG